ncbi:MAG: type II toxin-antitoxin system RelE/ParE family toxin [Propionibacteriaceae bacterium]|nr:type II toxin-antitoxin system RelE/ParE family toxin [Propionibacteriaceae bacterium]
MWTLVYAEAAAEQLGKLDRAVARRIQVYMDGVLGSGDPRSRGHSLSGPLSEYWRYRVGDYRVLVSIQDNQLTVVALRIGHRSMVYRDQP